MSDEVYGVSKYCINNLVGGLAGLFDVLVSL